MRLSYSVFFVMSVLVHGSAPPQSISLRSDAEEVGKYEKIEFEIGVDTTYRRPFDPDEVDTGLLVMLQAN